MCGIAAIIERDAARVTPDADIAGMVEALRHRGPDDEGHVCVPGAALGMRRLAIVDLATGQQPISNETGDVHIVANGEIYNFLELRRELEALGHRFKTRSSDIESLLHAWEAWGEAFPSRVRGMFAVIIWDARTRTLFAARDRAGEKPLYWTSTERGLLFGSEVKAILTRPEVPRALDLEALDQFMTFEYVIAPRTMLQGVQALPAGSWLRFRDGALTVQRYWDPSETTVRAWQDDEAADAVRETLRRAVTSQLMSEVPLGAFLSGGIDSSALVALMSEGASQPVRTFSMGFEDGSYDELPYAREVATRFGTAHTEQLVTADLVDLFERLVPHFDEPFADVSLFPTYLVSQVARAHVTVALSGDGGDELFGGYDTYEAQALAARFAAVGAPLVPALAALGAALPPTGQKKGLVNKFKRFIRGVATAPADLEHYRWMVHLDARRKERLYSGALRSALASSDVYRPVRDVLAHAGGDDTLNRQLYADLMVYLASDILVKVDRMAMATSLETRAPFLDVDVMELAFSLPGHLKIRDGQRKWVLKRAMRGLLPDSVLHRKKQGFSIPLKNWLRVELAPLMHELLAPERVAARGLFVPGEVQALVDAHIAGRENHAHTLFPLMVFERWATAHLP
ncbi:MAG: asparagine synthase (glutamine-hydrolyzing) [Acidobacteria bacterium]|nr:asparagine synthase (glutamine-hydrolyzing) [Acidobacteriota bacterium]